MGSLMIEENVVAEAGTVHYLTLDQIRDSISELGFTLANAMSIMNCWTKPMSNRPLKQIASG